jgi:hypothetical protein
MLVEYFDRRRTTCPRLYEIRAMRSPSPESKCGGVSPPGNEQGLIYWPHMGFLEGAIPDEA